MIVCGSSIIQYSHGLLQQEVRYIFASLVWWIIGVPQRVFSIKVAKEQEWAGKLVNDAANFTFIYTAVWREVY